MDRKCYFCGTTLDLHKHHIFGGTARRQQSEKYKDICTVWLCADHHNMSSQSVHMNRQMDLALKVIAQKKFEKEYSREEFINVFGKSWL